MAKKKCTESEVVSVLRERAGELAEQLYACAALTLLSTDGIALRINGSSKIERAVEDLQGMQSNLEQIADALRRMAGVKASANASLMITSMVMGEAERVNEKLMAKYRNQGGDQARGAA